MVHLAHEPGAAGWKAQANPLSYSDFFFCVFWHCLPRQSFFLQPRIPLIWQGGNMYHALRSV